jgi:hypothetical protein
MSVARVANVGWLGDAAALKARFDAALGAPQLVALVSPTCEVCLDGVAMIQQGLDEPAGKAFEAHIVWTPVLSGDTTEAALEVAGARRLRRGNHNWDHTRSISEAVRVVLDLAAWDRTVAWDLYLLYRRAVPWTGALPSPTTWLHQLRIDDQPSLDADSLRSAMQAVTS